MRLKAESTTAIIGARCSCLEMAADERTTRRHSIHLAPGAAPNEDQAP